MKAKYESGAEFKENRSLELYAVWEKYYISVSGNQQLITIGEEGCDEANAKRILAASNYDGAYSVSLSSLTGITDWAHVKVVNKDILVWADPNKEGTGLRYVTIKITNEVGAECGVQIQQEGNFVRLYDNAGVLVRNGAGADIMFDKNGRYNDVGAPRFNVTTSLGEFTCDVEYLDGATNFLNVNVVDGKTLSISCVENTGTARKAVLIIKSGSVVRRYSVEQKPATISVTYRYVDPSSDETIELYVHEQDCGTGFNESISGLSVNQEVRLDDKVLVFSGWWSTGDFRILKQGQQLYGDVVCDAYYAKYEIGVDFDTSYSPYQEYLEKKLGAEFVDNVVRFHSGTSFVYDYRGVPDYSSFFPKKEKKYVEDLMAYSSNLWIRFYEYPIQGLSLTTESVLNSNSSFLSLKPTDVSYLKGNARCWTYTVSCDEYLVEIVKDQNGDDVLQPYEESRQEEVSVWSYTGVECGLEICQNCPKVERQGWDERLLTYYGVSEDQYYDVCFAGKEINNTNCKLEVKHEISEIANGGGLINNTRFRIVYYGSSSFSAVSHDKVNESQTIYVRGGQVFDAMTWLAMYLGALERAESNGKPLSGMIQAFEDFFGDYTDEVETVLEAGGNISDVVDIGKELKVDLSGEVYGKILLDHTVTTGAYRLVVTSQNIRDLEQLKKNINLGDPTTVGKMKGILGKTLGGAIKIFGYLDIALDGLDNGIRWELKADVDYVRKVHNAVYDIYNCDIPEVFRGVKNGFFIEANNGLGGKFMVTKKGQKNVSPQNPYEFEWNKIYTVTEIEDFWETTMLSMNTKN